MSELWKTLRWAVRHPLWFVLPKFLYDNQMFVPLEEKHMKFPLMIHTTTSTAVLGYEGRWLPGYRVRVFCPFFPEMLFAGTDEAAAIAKFEAWLADKAHGTIELREIDIEITPHTEKKENKNG